MLVLSGLLFQPNPVHSRVLGTPSSSYLDPLEVFFDENFSHTLLLFYLSPIFLGPRGRLATDYLKVEQNRRDVSLSKICHVALALQNLCSSVSFESTLRIWISCLYLKYTNFFLRFSNDWSKTCGTKDSGVICLQYKDMDLKIRDWA